MRALASLLALAIAAAPLSGCFVFDEIDAGRAMMEKNSPKKKPEKAKAEKAGGGAEGAGADPRAAAREWWSQARTLSSQRPASEATDDPDALLRCQLGGALRFMRRGDCLSQGGHPADR